MNFFRKHVAIYLCALLAFSSGVLSTSGFADEVEEAASVEEGTVNQPLDARGELDRRMMICQRFNYEYRQCIAAGCLFDGITGTCYGRGNPGPNPPPPPPPYPGHQPQFCSQFNYNQYECNRSGCYYDHRTGACFDGGNYPPNPHGHRVMCIAVDAGFEEHSRGHMGVGYNRYSAEQAAMGECLRYHGRCRIRECRQQFL